jgi:hypothetical protein
MPFLNYKLNGEIATNFSTLNTYGIRAISASESSVLVNVIGGFDAGQFPVQWVDLK